MTLTTLWAPSQERCPLPGLNVKKSVKIRLCVMTPVTTASSISISIVQMPTSLMPVS